MNDKVTIEYYSDVLCIWAWIAQRRLDELNQQLGDKVEIRYRYMNIFGDVHHKMKSQWQDRGGFSGFAQHVKHSAEPYEDAIVHDNIWQSNQPTTSANAHLFLKAIELVAGSEFSGEIARQVRKAFYCECQDISNFSVLKSLIEPFEVNIESILQLINNGQAMAALMNDYKTANDNMLKGSPSYIIDNGRQVLFGNVGYRVLLANVEEQLKNPSNEASWC